MKASHASAVKKFVDIPNVGPAMAKDFIILRISSPADLKKYNAYKLYRQLCKVTNKRHDPCVLDTFLAVVDFMNGAPAKPWWNYTAQRKKQFPTL